jgi:hypothetical protein
MNTKKAINQIFFILEICAFATGQFGRLSPWGGVNLYFFEVLIAIHTAVNIGMLYPTIISFLNQNRPKVLPIFLWIIYLLIVVLLQTFTTPLMSTLVAVGYIIRLSNFLVFAFVIFGVRQNLSLSTRHFILALSLMITLPTGLQYVFWPDLRYLSEFGWDPHMYRAVGTILDPPIVGSLSGMIFMYILVKNRGKVGAIIKIIWAMFFASIVFLFSRSTYIAVLVVSTWFFAFKKQFKNLVLFISFFLLAIHLAPKTVPANLDLESSKIARVSTVASRHTEILTGLKTFVYHPIWGIGYNRVRDCKLGILRECGDDVASYHGVNLYINHSASAYHSFWVTLLATTGIIGAVWFFYIIKSVVFAHRSLAMIFVIPAIIGFFDNTLFSPFVVYSFILIALDVVDQ